MKLNKNLFYVINNTEIHNPYCAESSPWISVDPFKEYGLTQDDLISIYKTQDYLDWLKKVGDGCFDEEE